MKIKNIIDISLEIKEGATVYPGNPEVHIQEYKGTTSVHSKISFGTHTGTHVDSPRHVFDDGVGVDQMDLGSFIGKCKVFDFSQAKKLVSLEDIKTKNIEAGDRILLKTSNSARGFDSFYDDYVYLSGDAADYLAKMQVKLVGIDYFSIKKRGGDDHRPHTSLLEKEIAIIEGINLREVSDGEYFLSAAPLKITQGDGAPARAVLIQF